MSPSIRVLVVDDFEPFRQFVVSTLRQRPEFQIVGEASDGVGAVQKAFELQPDVLVLDIGLPKLNGIEAARQISERAPNAKIVFLSENRSMAVVQEALRVGGGYVLKSSARGDLLPALDCVLAGQSFVSSSLNGRKLSH